MREVTTRDDLAKLFFELGYTVGAEIGVFRGDYSEILLSENRNLLLYCIDPWEPFEDNRSARNLEKHFGVTKERLAKFNARIVRKTSAEALNDFQDELLDFVYIDAIHDYKNTYHDIAKWSRKVRVGGIVSGHDYAPSDRKRGKIYGVIPAVDNYVKENNINLFITKEVDSNPSFYWMKER